MSDTNTEYEGELGELAKRQLRLYWILDASGSMAVDGKIEAVNEALASSKNIIREAAVNNARGDLLVYAVRFNDDASWVSPEFGNGMSGSEFEWDAKLEAEGETYLGKAIELVAESLKTMPNNGFKPVLVLVTDGQPTDDFDTAFKKLTDTGWGRTSFRVALAIGDDADLAICHKFCSPEVAPLTTKSVEGIKKFIRWASKPKDGGISDPPPDMPSLCYTGLFLPLKNRLYRSPTHPTSPTPGRGSSLIYVSTGVYRDDCNARRRNIQDWSGDPTRQLPLRGRQDSR